MDNSNVSLDISKSNYILPIQRKVRIHSHDIHADNWCFLNSLNNFRPSYIFFTRELHMMQISIICGNIQNIFFCKV
uniref:Uncharacterized protein n=1 Tax=Arundo donax TaxID=35708 RepID=A0A0A9C5K3_ARUDO